MDDLYNPQTSITSIPQTRVVSVSGLEPVDTLKMIDYIRENTDLPATDEQVITDLITECRVAIERYLNFSIRKKIIEVYWENFIGCDELPDGPHGAITDVTRLYENDGTTEVAVEGTDYFLSGLRFKKINVNKKLSTRTYGVSHALRLQVEVGYDAVDVPEDIRLALKKTVATNYEYREAHGDTGTTIIPKAVKDSLSDHRRDIWL